MANKPNRVRIIGGKWRGRKIEFPSIDGLRPTTDPIRETLFNWLQPHLRQSNCLDLYAGSGALGFEAASRGAKNVLMIEKNTHIIRSLRANKELIDADNIRFMQRTALDYLKDKREQEKTQFDVVFLDPPFKMGALPDCTKWLEASGCLSDDAVIYIECERKFDLDFLPENWTQHRQKTTGQVSYYLYHRE
ncbi:MAG: 16S rRNA (guanine(966)-N(2))-methyltransferase RsmD [Piscirickettsiaceae bacterium]|nr:MAG: 16S rRNA (guanine(966)-N(2))-methyltransferase RsmD [Piscirickettsiaceae bacterium]